MRWDGDMQDGRNDSADWGYPATSRQRKRTKRDKIGAAGCAALAFAPLVVAVVITVMVAAMQAGVDV